jgi:hypothetical protein
LQGCVTADASTTGSTRHGRASNQTSANRFHTAKYANDQSEQPSLKRHGKSAPKLARWP